VSSFLKPTALKRALFFLFVDLILSLLTYFLSYELRFNFHVEPEFFNSFWLAFVLLAGLKIGALFYFKSYFIVWRFFSFSDAKNIIKAHIVAYALFALILLTYKEAFAPYPRSVIVIDFFLSLFVIGFFRILKRLLTEGHYLSGMKPALVVGVSGNTPAIIKSALDGEIPYYPVAIVALESDEKLINSYINNVKIFDSSVLQKVVGEREIGAAIIAEKLSQNKLKEMVERLGSLGISEIKQVKLLGSRYEKLEDLSIEDLLARHPQDLDEVRIASFVKEKRILITGAGGSIGSEIARLCQAFGASHLTLVDNGEYNLYRIAEAIPDATHALVSVVDKTGLASIFEQEKPDIVIHAAAYKHVPLCEENVDQAVENNIMGSINVIDLSIEYGVSRVVMVSTDKAVRPTNVMGATKRVMELYAGNVESGDTEIVAVRFGNVLGSSGSVIPKFKKQIEEGGPVTVTDARMTRYFMLVSEACQLVLQAAAIAKGGELFVLDMGEPVRIVDLAKQMIRLYGKEEEVRIVFTGMRPGEKLYEELLLDEDDTPTNYQSIFVAKSTHYPIDQLHRDIQRLIECSDKRAQLKVIVPEYESQQHRNTQIPK
jgi:UDP-N-acetyl-D-glucosamine 4,6-dehydratase